LPSRLKKLDQVFALLLSRFDFDYLNQKSWQKPESREWVSRLDLEINDFLLKQLNKFFPGERIISEEGERFDYSGSFWIIDPIDGTHNFLRGSPLFGINLAYCSQGEPIVAGILFPWTKEIWLAEKNGGVWLNSSRFRNGYQGKPMVFAESALRKVSSRYLSLLKRLSEKGFSVRMPGSTSWALASLARSRGMFCAEKAHLWDIAPGLCLLRELGAKIFDFSQNQWSSESDSLVIIFSLTVEEESLFWSLVS